MKSIALDHSVDNMFGVSSPFSPLSIALAALVASVSINLLTARRLALTLAQCERLSSNDDSGYSKWGVRDLNHTPTILSIIMLTDLSICSQVMLGMTIQYSSQSPFPTYHSKSRTRKSMVCRTGMPGRNGERQMLLRRQTGL